MTKKQIVIVEDESLIAIFLCEALKDEYEIFVIKSGTMAINVIKAKKPDLVMLDLILPDIHGFEVLKALKNDPDESIRSIPVMITTGDSADDSAEQGLKLGAADYVMKPYKASLIRRQVRNQMKLVDYRNNMCGIIQQQTINLRNIHNALIGVISLLVDERDGSTGSHINKTVQYMGVLIGLIDEHRMLIPEEDIEFIVALSSLHDVGKITTADSILLKDGPLTREEFEEMKRHTTNGGNLLRRAKAMFVDTDLATKIGYAVEMAEFHHERYDGSGYPYGLKGENIPFVAKMLQICDVYDALTSVRCYKPAYSHNEAFQIIINGDGRSKPEHFDPVVLEAFICAEREFAKICDS